MRTSKPNKRFQPPTYQVIAKQHSALTDQGQEMLECLAAGMTCREASSSLGMPQSTGNWVKMQMLKDLGASSEPHAVAIAVAAGILKIKAVK